MLSYYNVIFCFVDDLLSSQLKLAKYYDSFFTEIILYRSDKEPENKALREIYVPMVWKQIKDPNSADKDVEIKSPLELFKKVRHFTL